MRKYTIEQIKKGEIWVKCSGDHAVKFFNAVDGNSCKFSGDNNFYRKLEMGNWEVEGNKPASYIEFSQVIFEGEGNIIGYKSPTKLYNHIPKGTMYNRLDAERYVCCSDMFDDKLPAEIVELWEPVYGEEFKEGDWVVVESNIEFGEEKKCNNADFYKVGMVGVITEVSDGFYSKWIKLNNHGNGITTNQLRKATPQEIEDAQKIMIGDYEVEFRVSSSGLGYIAVCGEIYSHSEIEAIKKILFDKQIKSLNVGCSGQYKVDLDLINKIINRLKK